jgi:UDP-sugar transporter A1/2/3
VVEVLHMPGYTLVVWCVAGNLAFTGLLVSWIMKFADTIVKVYSTSMAMLVTMLISAWLFDLQPSLQLLLGILTATASLNLYYMNPLDLMPERSQVMRNSPT